jgi:hypothetical protein
MKTHYIACSIVPLLLLSSCNEHPAFPALLVKATEWQVYDTRVCEFFIGGPASNPGAGCWENEDNGSYSNKDDRESDQLYLMEVDMPKDKYQRLSEGHNAVLVCVRDTNSHLACE